MLREWAWSLVIVMGNPGVSQGYPYPYPLQPIPASRGMGFSETQGYSQPVWVYLYNRPRNLAMALRMSIDIAIWHCEVTLGVVDLALGLSPSCWDVWPCVGSIEHLLGHSNPVSTPCFYPIAWVRNEESPAP